MSASRTGSYGVREVAPLVLIAGLAVVLRTWHLDRGSLWYDEVVTMRLARAPSIGAMIRLLDTTDATRAPLHPLILMGWMRLLGPSDLASRFLSVVFGVAALALVYDLGRRAFGEATARGAALLGAVCPPLVWYSQEVRMYAPLVFLAVASWWQFLRLQTEAPFRSLMVYGLLLTALVYCHPLGLFMVAAHVLAYGLVGRGLAVRPAAFATVMAAVGLAVLPWMGRYLDHAPDYPLPRYPIRFLIGMPIEYVGGNSLTLIPLGMLIVCGLFTGRDGRPALRDPVRGPTVACWFAVPPVLLYIYSFIGYPIFGPSRYTLFVAPVYLLLLARGMAVVPRAIGLPALLATLALMLSNHHTLGPIDPPIGRADWRALAVWLRTEAPTPAPAVVVVHPHDALFPGNHLEAARYYLEPRATVLPDDQGTPPVDAYHAHVVADPHWRPEAGQNVIALFRHLAITVAAPGDRPAAPPAAPGAAGSAR